MGSVSRKPASLRDQNTRVLSTMVEGVNAIASNLGKWPGALLAAQVLCTTMGQRFSCLQQRSTPHGPGSRYVRGTQVLCRTYCVQCS